MRVYVLIRKDLSASQCAVQGGHALAELCQNYDVSEWAKDHRTLIYLHVKNENELVRFFESLTFEKKAIFREPDLRNEATAIAVLTADKAKEFKKLRLM